MDTGRMAGKYKLYGDRSAASCVDVWNNGHHNGCHVEPRIRVGCSL